MKRPDVVVIGGGIVGCAAAYFLARAGLRPLVVERAGISGGSSSACMGHLMLMSRPEPMYRLSRRSLILWKQFHRDVGGFAMRNCGVLWLGESDADLPLLENLHDEITGHGEEGHLLSREEMLAKEPALARELVGAFYYPEDAVVFPMQAAGALLGAALQHGGGAVQHHTTVLGISRSADGAVRGVATDRGEIEAEIVVNAAGVWTPDVQESAGLPRLPIYPRRGELAITMPQDLRIQHQLTEVAYLRTAVGAAADPEGDEPDPGASAVVIQPQSNNTLLIGSTRQFAGYDTTVNTRLLHTALQRAVRFVPCIADLQIVRTWAGLRPYTRDKVPIIGPVSGMPGYFVAAGHEGLGLTFSMATGELIAQAVRGESTAQPLTPFLPDRFTEVMTDG